MLSNQARVSPQGINRILDAVAMKKSRPHFDKDILVQTINICAKWYNEALKYNFSEPQKIERKHFREVGDVASRLASLLSTPPVKTHPLLSVLSKELFAKLSELRPSIDRVLELRRTSVARNGEEYDYLDVIGYRDHFKMRSPIDWLVGVYLSEVYDLHFGFLPSRRRTSKYVSFAASVLKELKIKNGVAYYSPNYLARIARESRLRRKLVSDVDTSEYDLNREMHLLAACGLDWKLYSLESASKILVEREHEAAATAPPLRC